MILDQRHWSDPLGGHRGWGQNSTSSEQGHVAYQIKRNHKCSNMVGNILPVDPPANTGGLNVKNSEYDQEIPQSQPADNPMATRGRATQPSPDTRKTN